jgi:flavin-binding protein dodecin
MSTYYTTYPQTVSFLSMSEAFQASENWIPTLGLTLEVIEIQSKATEKLRDEYAVLDDEIQLAYDYLCQQINDVMLWWQRDGVTLNPDLLSFIQNTYLSRDLLPPSFRNSHFNILSPNLHPDTAITDLGLAVVRPDWVEEIREEFSSSSDNLFSGLGTALFSLYVNSNLEGQAFEEQMELNKQLILQFQERTFDRTARRGELSDAIRSLNQNINLEVSSALQNLVADYFTLSLPWQPPAEDETMFNVKAKVTTLFTKPSRAEAVYEVISVELRDVRDHILQELQDLFPQYVIPLTTAPPSYNPTNQPTQPNLRLTQNGKADRYPVRDELSGSFLWVGGDLAYFGFDRYGGNSSAVPNMKEFIKYIFPEVQVVSEYDVEYQLSGRDDFDDYLADLAACTEEGDLEALAEQYNVYCDPSEVSEHIAVLSTLPVDDLNRPVMVNSIPLEEVYGRAEAYDTVVRDSTETFNTQRGETLSMESEQSRPFFNPEGVEPYELSESPSGSEVSYGAEISTNEMVMGYGEMDRPPKSAYIRPDFKRFGLEYPIITFYDVDYGLDDGEIMGWMNDRTQPYSVIRSSGVTEEDVNNFIKAWNQWAQSRGLLDAYGNPVSLMPYPWDGDYYDYRTMRSPGAGASVENIRNYYRDDLGETFNSEWGTHQLDGDGYCEICDAYGLNCIEQGGNSPESIAAVEEAIRNLENSLQSLKAAGVTDMRELKSAIKQAKLKMYSMMNENRCTCDREYGEADPDCMACLNEWRNQRYGPDIHDVECVCNDCVPMGGYSSYAESFDAEDDVCINCGDSYNPDLSSDRIMQLCDECGYCGFHGYFKPLHEGCDWCEEEEEEEDDWDAEEHKGKVRTMSGKPHTPRKLIKDKSIRPEEAAKRKQISAENKKDETVVDKTEESGITTETRQYKKKKYNPDKMKTDIPADVLNQTDSDDNWVILFSGILGAGVAAMLTNWAWMKRVQGD